jgi:hypothetical protein
VRKQKNSQALPRAGDIEEVRKLLSTACLAEIEAVKAEATAELVKQLSASWESVPMTREGLRDHDPSEFVPPFEQFAERQYDAYAEGLLGHVADVHEYFRFLSINVTDAISNEILPISGFTPDDPLSGEWTTLARTLARRLKSAPPESRADFANDLLDLNGAWEIYLTRSFDRRLLKSKPESRNWRDPKARERVESVKMSFRLKYQLHLRLFVNWYDFDRRLRAHLSDRWKIWRGRWYRRAAEAAREGGSGSPIEVVRVGDAPQVHTSRSPKDFVDAVKRHPKRSYEKLASYMGISKDTLYAITNENRWVSDESYEIVAKVCSCKATDLHPRDLPRPANRRT